MNLTLLLAALTFFKINPYADFPHMPSEKPADAVEATSFAAAAARGEFESVSFLALPDADLKRVDFAFGDLTGPGGAKIPASAIDLKTVKVWYQPDGFWETTWAGNINRPKLIPAIVLHDDTLIRVDEEQKINYVRLDYTTGSVYKRMSGTDVGDFLNHSIEPLADAKKFVPFDLRGGRYQQYWLTYKVPMDAKPGTYRATVPVTSEGKKVAEIALSLEVYPFSLPSARTHYDSSRPYMCSVMHGCDVATFLGQGHSLPAAERKAFNTYKLMAEHNITHPHGPGLIKKDSTDDLAIRTLYLMREAGLPCKPLFAAGTCDNSWYQSTGPGDAPAMRSAPDPKAFQENMRHVEEYAQRMHSAFDRLLGHHDAYYYGVDEAQPYMCRWQYGIWSHLKKHGGKIFATSGNNWECGWSIDCCDSPALLSHSEARSWHRDGGIVMTYAAPFLGPECPSIFRRTKGIRFYYADFDGPNEYVFYYHARNRWNEFIPSPDGYRSFGIVYPCYDGMIGTVALEGLREGIDDVRYLSLLKLRAEAAMASKDKAVALRGRQEICWLDSRDPDRTGPLDEFRREVVRRIQGLVALVGPQPDEPAPKSLGKLPPHEVDRMAADTKIPLKKRAENCERAGRYDLAIPFYAELRKDESFKASERLDFVLKEVNLRLVMLDRAGALAALDECLAQRNEFKKGLYGTLMVAKAKALLTPVEFCEHFDPAKLDVAAKQLELGLAIPGVNQGLRYEVAWQMAKAYLNSENPLDSLAFAERCEKKYAITGYQLGCLIYCGVEAHRRLKHPKEEYALLKKVLQLGGGNLIGDARTIHGELGACAEREGDFATAQIYYSIAVKQWPPNNDLYYPRYRAALARVSKRAGEQVKKKMLDNASMEEQVDITLDEEP